uniref:Uncharacterized protein n=1 Tax=Trichogramma kaykai TaxID=54128 RepID=A0ABD2WNI6_9HYME
MVPAKVNHRYTIRFALAAPNASDKDVGIHALCVGTIAMPDKMRRNMRDLESSSLGPLRLTAQLACGSREKRALSSISLLLCSVSTRAPAARSGPVFRIRNQIGVFIYQCTRKYSCSWCCCKITGSWKNDQDIMYNIHWKFVNKFVNKINFIKCKYKL